MQNLEQQINSKTYRSRKNQINTKRRQQTQEKDLIEIEYNTIKFENKSQKGDNSNATSEYFELYDKINPKETTERQKYYLDIAAKVAMKSAMNHKHGAIIVYKKKIIATGFNYIFNHFSHDFSIHAEIDAISSIKGKLKDILNECELYVVRIGPEKFKDFLKYSKPCPKCQHSINKCGIKKAYYSTNYQYDDFKKK